MSDRIRDISHSVLADREASKNKNQNKDKFNSTDVRRVSNNPEEELNSYTGPDDVALRYNALSDDEKTNMLRVKLATQYLINELRALGSHRDIDLAIEHAQDASMRGVRFITQSSKQ